MKSNWQMQGWPDSCKFWLATCALIKKVKLSRLPQKYCSGEAEKGAIMILSAYQYG